MIKLIPIVMLLIMAATWPGVSQGTEQIDTAAIDKLKAENATLTAELQKVQKQAQKRVDLDNSVHSLVMGSWAACEASKQQ